MRTLRCKCGASIAWTSDTMHDCQGCEKCNTTYAGNPGEHKELQPHQWVIRYNEYTGKPYKVCDRCHSIDSESYKESKRVDNNSQTVTLESGYESSSSIITPDNTLSKETK